MGSRTSVAPAADTDKMAAADMGMMEEVVDRAVTVEAVDRAVTEEAVDTDMDGAPAADIGMVALVKLLVPPLVSDPFHPVGPELSYSYTHIPR